MQLRYVIVYVNDVPASLDFYERAFGLQRGFLHESGEFGELVTGETKLGFAHHATARSAVQHDYVAADRSPHPLGMEVGFTVADVPAACERAVQAGATLLAPPSVKPWGQTVAYVRCPDGSLVELCTSMD
jgi:catechol 2,3-dioxygenase-like lactoylglutathione lyase family enzyme